MSGSDQLSTQQRYDKLLTWLNLRNPVCESRQDGLVTLKRTWNASSTRAEWAKTHTGNLSALAENEQEVLNAVSGKFKHVIQPLAIQFPTTLAPDASGQAGPSQLLARDRVSHFIDAGLDLDDWFFLLDHATAAHPFADPVHWLALVHQMLAALLELHVKDFVHCDIKADNMCLQLQDPDALSSTSAVIEKQLDLMTLKLIDVQLTLGPDRNGRKVWRKPPLGTQTVGDPLPVGQRASYMSAHFKNAVKKATDGDMAVLRALDWRIDLYSLGCMLEQVLNHYPLQLNTKQSNLFNWITELPDRLKSYDSDPLTNGGVKPHESLMKEIADLVKPMCPKGLPRYIPVEIPRVYPGLGDEEGENSAQPFGASMSKFFNRLMQPSLETEIDIGTRTQHRPSHPHTKPLVAATVAGLVLAGGWALGGEQAWAWAKTLQNPWSQPDATALSLQDIANAAGGRTTLIAQPEKTRYGVGEPLYMLIKSTTGGHLTVLVQGTDGLLHLPLVSQPIDANTPVRFPSELEPWPTQGPAGKAQLLAVVTPKPLSSGAALVAAGVKADGKVSLPMKELAALRDGLGSGYEVSQLTELQVTP